MCSSGLPRRHRYLVRGEIQEKVHFLSEFFDGTGEIKDLFQTVAMRNQSKSVRSASMRYTICFQRLVCLDEIFGKR